MRASSAALCALLVLLPGCFAPASPPPPPPPGISSDGWPTLALDLVADGFFSPVQLVHDDAGGLYVVEQNGRVLAERDGVWTEWLNVRDRVRDGGERGLLSMAFDPAFARSGHVWISYTDTRGDSVLARLSLAPGTGRPDPASAVPILRVEQPYANHNGGLAVFGPDGMLWLGLGDGGAAGDPHGHGQDTMTLLGTILRLDVRGEDRYAIPADNPFEDGGAAAREVWAYGLRNPWRFSFDRETGDLWIADVGQNRVEEVNYEPARSGGGRNYGWNVWEGSSRFRPGPTRGEAVFPVHEYARDTPHCSITGGFVYRGEDVPALRGTYVFGDYCSGEVWGLRGEEGAWVARELLRTGLRISSFGEDAAGELYVVDHGGTLHRVVAG